MGDDYLRQIFVKCVAAILGSHELRVDKATFEHIVLLAELRMQTIYSDLAQLIKIQRRTQPTLQDLTLWITRNNIDLVDSKPIGGKHVETLNGLKFNFDVETIPNEAAVFFDPQLFQIKKIIQSREQIPSYAPEWSPTLPPDHTYMATADYANQVRGLQELHEKLFEEGHLAELALQRLLGTNGSASAINLARPDESGEEMRVEEMRGEQRNGGDGDVSMELEPVESEAVEQPAPVKEELVEHTNESVPATTATDEAASEKATETPQSHSEPILKIKLGAPSKPQGEDDEASMEPVEDGAEDAPKSYVTIVNSEAPPPPPPTEKKPISFKINLRKPKKQKVSTRPRVDIVDMAKKHALEAQQQESNNTNSGPVSLSTLLEKAMASIDA